MVSKIDVFSAIGLKKWSWLHYNELNNAAYCFTCTKAIKEKKVKTGNMDACFVSSGFTNWKGATCAFKRHKVSDAHKAAIEAIVTIPKTTKDIGTALCEGYKQEVEKNRIKNNALKFALKMFAISDGVFRTCRITLHVIPAFYA